MVQTPEWAKSGTPLTCRHGHVWETPALKGGRGLTPPSTSQSTLRSLGKFSRAMIYCPLDPAKSLVWSPVQLFSFLLLIIPCLLTSRVGDNSIDSRLFRCDTSFHVGSLSFYVSQANSSAYDQIIVVEWNLYVSLFLWWSYHVGLMHHSFNCGLNQTI